MTVLGLDSSGAAASVGIYKDGKVIVSYTLNHERTHSEKLMEMVDNALNIARMEIKDIDSFAITVGPGSFTGIRIGTACVKGLAAVGSKPVYPVSYLDSLYEAVNCGGELPVCVTVDAGRGEVYYAVYEGGRKLGEDSYADASALASELSLKYEKMLFTGDGVLKYGAVIRECFKNALLAEKEFLFGSGASVIKAALEFSKAVPPEMISPVYLKKSQAERMKEKENGK